MKQALIVYGGWEGHEPKLVAEFVKSLLGKHDFSVEISDTLDAFLSLEKLKTLDLIVPVWTMGTITEEQLKPVLAAVESGTGLAGCHGGMCDAFRNSTEWQFMTGGQWVSHPGNDGVDYTVNVRRGLHPIVEGIPDFQVKSEQYYMHIDPAVQVLATTDFPLVPGPHSPNGRVAMPVLWTKLWGQGRVFFNALGHHADVLYPEPVATLFERGLIWAAR